MNAFQIIVGIIFRNHWNAFVTIGVVRADNCHRIVLLFIFPYVYRMMAIELFMNGMVRVK
jgi:hypothetical protein